MPPPETNKSQIGSQPTTCQVRTGAYVRLTTHAWKKKVDTRVEIEAYHKNIKTTLFTYSNQTHRALQLIED